ncbi:MAG: hypothetical protein LM513_00195 [Nitrospira sp.]|nr:hypothetical protein [Nitrospira sp.]
MTNTENLEYTALQRYLAELSDEQLYEILADSAGLGADEINRAAEGRMIFSRIWHKHKKQICGNALVSLYIKDPNTSDATAVAAQLINIFINIPGINVAVVAALSLRIGLRKLCASLTDET